MTPEEIAALAAPIISQAYPDLAPSQTAALVAVVQDGSSRFTSLPLPAEIESMLSVAVRKDAALVRAVPSVEAVVAHRLAVLGEAKTIDAAERVQIWRESYALSQDQRLAALPHGTETTDAGPTDMNDDALHPTERVGRWRASHAVGQRRVDAPVTNAAAAASVGMSEADFEKMAPQFKMNTARSLARSK